MSEKNVRVLNDLELSGGLTFTNNLSGFPENPKPRTLVVKDGVPYLYTELVNGSGYFSWTPIGYRQGAYVHSQGVASTVWTVSHNFNTVNFGYFVYDANHKLVVANVNVIDANTIQIELSEAITGTAVIFSTESIFAGVLSASTEVSLGNITLRDASGVLTVNNNAVAMKAALDTEVAARTAADSALSARIDSVVSNIDPAALDSLTEVVAAFQNTQGNVAAALSDLSTNASSALADEISRATTAELTIASDLAAEVTRATQAEAALATQIAASGYTLPAATASTLGGVKQGTNITIASDGTISAQTSAAAAGSLTGSTLSANVTASSLTSVGTLSNLTVTNTITGSVSGNAGTATKLATARTINGVSFDGSANITLPASAPSLAQNYIAFGGASGTLTSNSQFTYDVTTGAFTLGAGSGGAYGASIMSSPSNGATEFVIQASWNAPSQSGNSVKIQGGDSIGGGTTGGNVTIAGGVGSTTSGAVIFKSGATETARITPTGAVSFGSTGTNTGTAGQVLLSGGSGSAPTWGSVTMGTQDSLTVTNAVTAGSLVAGNITVSGDSIVSTNPTITIDPTTAGVGGLVVIAGNLQVTGTTTTINSTTVTTSDLNIQLAKDAVNAAAANGAGLSVAGAGATLTYTSADDRWNLNKALNVSEISGNAATATKLATARNINGVAFDGTADITITATATSVPAANLTGSTLSANVTASSLTSVGTLTSLAVTGTATIGTVSATNMTVGGTAVGYLTVPQNAQGAYTLVLSDSGKHIFTSSGGVTWTIPANGSVAFPIGTAVTFVNQSAVTCSIAITSDSMYLAGAGTLGTRTLAAYGMATAIKVSATSWMISGNLT